MARALMILLAAALAATACSSTQLVDPAEAATNQVEAVALTSDGDVAPFDAVLIELFGTDDTDEYLMTVERDAAELVVLCMEAAGFEFQIPAEAVAASQPDPRSIADAETMGFGIIASFRGELDDFDPTAAGQVDPNRVYLSTLTAAEIQRFLLTLQGVEAEPGQLREDGGCNGSASEEAYGDWNRFFDTLPAFTALGEERDTHPDWVSTRSLWRDCMVERGFDYAEPEVIRTDVITRMRATVAELYPDGQLPLVQQDGVFMVDPEVNTLLDELFEFEQQAAIANVECTLPLADRFDAVEHEVQQSFVDRNRVAIDELLAATP